MSKEIQQAPPELILQNLEDQTQLQVISSRLQSRIDLTDSIYISSFNNYGGNPPQLLLTYRILLDSGKIIFAQEAHTCRIFTDYAEQVTVISPAVEGSILSLSVQVSSETFRRGQVYVQVGLFNGLTVTANNRKNVLLSGYVATSFPLTYPGRLETPNEVQRFAFHGTFSGALPYYITPYSTQSYEPFLIYIDYSTDGTAGNRRLFLELQDASANTLGLFFTGLYQAASLTYYYIFSRRQNSDTAVITAGSSNNYVQVDLPEFVIPKGGRIKVDCLNRQSGDGSSFARLTGRECVSL